MKEKSITAMIEESVVRKACDDWEETERAVIRLLRERLSINGEGPKERGLYDNIRSALSLVSEHYLECLRKKHRDKFFRDFSDAKTIVEMFVNQVK